MSENDATDPDMIAPATPPRLPSEVDEVREINPVTFFDKSGFLEEDLYDFRPTQEPAISGPKDFSARASVVIPEEFQVSEDLIPSLEDSETTATVDLDKKSPVPSKQAS